MINMSKVCIDCKQTKSLQSFSKDKSKNDGLQKCCKSCKQLHSKEWRINNPLYGKQYLEKNKEQVRQVQQVWLENNPNYQKNYDNRTEVKKRKNKQRKNKRNNDPSFTLHGIINTHIAKGIKNITKEYKNNTTLQIVGLESWDKFREYIESLWTEKMNWDNYGKLTNCWSIDHIIPKSSAKTEEDVYKLNHYTNLRPMWHVENIKKSNKIFGDV